MGKMDSGGKKTLAMEYFRHIDQREIQFHFVCDADSQAVPEDEIQERGGKVHYITPYQNIFKNMRDIQCLCTEEHFDVIHAYNSTMNMFPMLAGKLAGVPVRISESLSMAHEKEAKTYVKRFLRPTSKMFATHLMACGEDCGRWQFGDKLFERGEVEVFKTAINSEANAFDPDLREKTRKAYGLKGKMVVGYIGRFVSQKNPFFLLEVFKELRLIKPEAVLLLIGDGPLRNEMLAYIEREDIAESVVYLGRREDIVQFYQAMDCFLLPSLYEGLPVVGLEAQCSGLPVLFSSEITREVAFAPVVSFHDLKDTPSVWAEEIVSTLKNAPIRSSHVQQCIDCGFDSKAEGLRLAKYYEEKTSAR